MNEPQTRTDRIIGWLKKPKFWLGLVIALAIAAVIGSVVFSFFSCYTTNPKFLQEGWGSFVSSLSPCSEELSARLIAIAGGLVAVAVLFETRRRANAAEKALGQTDKALGQTEKALGQTEKSIVQKTFSDAITHLGHENENVILGGIYSLLDLAKESSDYGPRVFNLLCAHIKTTTEAEEYQKKHPKQPSTRIQRLLSSLFKDEEYRFFTDNQAEKKYRADLSGAYLAGSELSGTRLQGSNLAGAKLQGAKLNRAKLPRADLTGAQLQGALLRKAQLQGAFLVEAQLQEAYLGGALLQGARLREAQLQGANLREATLQGTSLWEAQLQGANLRKAQLLGADLIGANLQGADLTEAKLQGADLTEAKLQGAKLRQAEMQGACMHRTQLPHETQMSRSDLRGVSSHEDDEFHIDFQERIKSRINKKSDLAGVVFDDEAMHSNTATPKNKDTAIKGSYTKEEADRWIKKYEEALDWEKDKG